MEQKIIKQGKKGFFSLKMIYPGGKYSSHSYYITDGVNQWLREYALKKINTTPRSPKQFDQYINQIYPFIGLVDIKTVIMAKKHPDLVEQGKKYDVIEIATSKYNAGIVYYIDQQSHLISRIGPATITHYNKIGLAHYPGEIVVQDKIKTRSTLKLTLNPKLPPDLFTKKQIPPVGPGEVTVKLPGKNKAKKIKK